MGVVYTLQVKGVLYIEYVVLFYYPKSSSPCVHAWVLGEGGGGGGGGGGRGGTWWYVHGSYRGGGACMGPTGVEVRVWVLQGWWCMYGSYRGGGTCMGPRGGVVHVWGGGACMGPTGGVVPPPTTPSSTISLCTTSLRHPNTPSSTALQECRVGVLYMECRI